MGNNVVFNISVCIIGILILFVHVVNILIKKNRRKDENSLLIFISFTVLHFFVYLMFTIIKMYYTSNNFVISFYTLFYIFNNIEVFLLFVYMMNYVFLQKNVRNLLAIFNIFLFSSFIILDIINVFTGIFFYAEDGNYIRSKTMIIAQGYQFVMLAVVFLVTILNKKLNIREKSAFAIYCFLPLVAIILQNIFKGYAIAYLSIIIAVEILFFFVNIQKNIDLAQEEKKNREAQITLMLSQIQPHFIYNSLSSISTLITIDPNRAQASLDDFTDYLRMNLSSITDTRLIPFEKELKHIKTYLSLEKIRFNDRLNVIYNIKTTDFDVPPLTIQPLVENAVKHGILKKIEGGTVTLKVYEDDLSYIIEVIDDGIGFNINDIDFNEDHYGLNNIRYRITESLNGTIEFNSEINVGTKVIVKFSK